jgi:glycosyltransferase involved in cell wall biosynthesis
MKSRKILIIMNDLKNGGVERVLSVLANYLAARDYDVHILTIAEDNVSYKLDPRIHHRHKQLLHLYKDESIGAEIKTVRGIFREMKEIDPDCVIGFDDSIIIRSVPSAWLQRRRIVVSERIDPSIYGAAMRAVRQAAYDMADAVVFQTPDARDYFPKRTRKKSRVIPNPLKEGLPERAEDINKDIVMACRLRAQKNVHVAIEGFAKFHAGHPDHRLVVYGEGELLGELTEHASRLGVGESVVFPGHTDEIHEIMSHAAMYLSSSDYEGLSNSMIEALAIGVPSICTDCPVGGARMFIENNVNGILVPVRNADAIAEALSRIADDVGFARALSSESVKIRELLSTDVICPQWEELL